MNLKDFLDKRDKPPELFWSLTIEPGWTQAGVWYIGQGSAEVVATSPPTAWEVEDELIGAVDAALSSCIAKLPESYVEPNKTVFGVPADWVKGGEIQDSFLGIIKKVCTDLSLNPVGFVVLPEAIAHLYKSEDGAPLSAIIVGLGKENLEVSVFQLGNLIGTTSVARSVSLIDDVTEGLSRFEGASPLPSRFIIYDGKGGELEDAKEELLKADWEATEKMKFMHTPKVETLESSRKVLATCLAGAAEIGQVSQISSQEENIQDEDLPLKEEVENIVPPEDETSAEDLGFSVGEDVSNRQTQPSLPQTPVVPVQPVNTNQFATGVKSLFHNFSSRIKIHGPKISSEKSFKGLYFLLGFLALVAIGAGLAWWFLPKAVVTVYVSPKSFQEQISLNFATDGTFDETKAIIPANVVSVQENGEKTKSTTGTKLVGDKSSGSVQIANGQGSPIDVAAGTILTSTQGLRFVTTADASVSAQLIPGSPGTATVAVTAGDIGAQYNLAKNEVFKIGVFDKSQVAATATADFSGGSSQQIAAVSADDQKGLETDLKNELSTQAINDLQSKADSNQLLVNSLAALDTTTENFDSKVGDNADTLKLALTVNATGIAADRAKLLQYAKDTLKSKIPQGYALGSDQISFQFTYVGKQNGLYNYNVAISANFLPQVDTNDLISKISGKTSTAAQDYLTTISGFTHAQIAISPRIPFVGNVLPHIPKNITIDLAPDQ